MSRSGKRGGRATLTVVCCMLALVTCTQLLPGVHADSLEITLVAGAALGVVYLLIRPILRILTLPIGCLTLGLFGFVIDTVFILLLDHYVPGFTVDGVLWALVTALVVDALGTIAGGFS